MCFFCYVLHVLPVLPFIVSYVSGAAPPPSTPPTKQKVLILGGGVAGVIAARTLHRRGIDDFVIIEGGSELGGRLSSTTFGKGKKYVIERGANWIQGTQQGNGTANPIYLLAKKHGLKAQFNDWYGSVATFDSKGSADYLGALNNSDNQFVSLTVLGGTLVDEGLIDVSARSGYSLIGAKPKSAIADACEYFIFDAEFAQPPVQSSVIATSWNNNYTYNVEDGGFSEENLISLDQRGYKSIIQLEAAEFLKPHQVMTGAVVKTVSYSSQGVIVTLTNGQEISGNYALCTFSLGVLQNDDVVFQPPLPAYKQEAIQSMYMGTYTKIFLQFPNKFWFDTEMAIYADPERGRYPVWQSLDHVNFLPGSGILFVTTTGDFSVRIERLSDARVKAEVMQVIRSMFPQVAIPEPLDFYFPRWHSDPLFRGSYSNWPPSFSSQHLDNLRANMKTLYFAGEATSRKYFGFLHGAYFEGLTMGELIADCVQAKTCSDLKRFPKITNASPYERSN